MTADTFGFARLDLKGISGFRCNEIKPDPDTVFIK